MFDFIPEGDELPALNEENFDEILARLMSKAADEDVDSIVLPPTLSFSYANLPFSPRELRTTIKVRVFAWEYFGWLDMVVIYCLNVRPELLLLVHQGPLSVPGMCPMAWKVKMGWDSGAPVPL